jgi:hypothetical protein
MRPGQWGVLFSAAVLLRAIVAVPLVAAQVTGHVTVTDVNGDGLAMRNVSVVLWLTPLAREGGLRPDAPNAPPHPRLIQKNKTFEPHVLAVQVGSAVDFPNHDPFFHNVFSLFDGKRFDLGLYEAGSTRGVHFDRAGICYIFCNIHPQMSAVVVVVDTPYFAVSDEKGEIVILHVPPGQYQLNIWEEHCTPKILKELARQVTVNAEPTSLGSVQLQESNEPATAHLNKYGKRYDPPVFSSPVYIQP